MNKIIIIFPFMIKKNRYKTHAMFKSILKDKSSDRIWKIKGKLNEKLSISVK